MSEKLLKYLIYIAAGISLVVFVFSHDLRLFNTLLQEKQVPEYFEFTPYGELYNMSRILDFKEEIPLAKDKYRLSERNPSIDSADIIAFGDSYFDFSRNVSVPERLSQVTGKKVHAIYSFYPLTYLTEINYNSPIIKPFIYETTERLIPLRFGMGNKMNTVNLDNPSVMHLRDRWLNSIFQRQANERYDLLLKSGMGVSDIYSQIATLKYRWFGYVAQSVHVKYLQNDPWLFYYESMDRSPSGFYYEHSEEEIEIYCDNILLLQQNLLNQFKLELIFFPVPNKYTVYHSRLGETTPYNNLLPRVFRGLKKRGVPYVNVYNKFVESQEVLYYRTDTHWNRKGGEIAVESLMKHLHQ